MEKYDRVFVDKVRACVALGEPVVLLGIIGNPVKDFASWRCVEVSLSIPITNSRVPKITKIWPDALGSMDRF